jgi:hypothetical protein
MTSMMITRTGMAAVVVSTVMLVGFRERRSCPWRPAR